jgi:hypothetical protein
VATDQEQLVTTGAWTARFGADEASAVSLLRLHADIRACAVNDEIWIRGDRCDAAMDRVLLRLAPRARYQIQQDGTLIPFGCLLPTAQLPAAEWKPIGEFLAVQQPVAALSGAVGTRTPLQLLRDGREREATLLLASMQDWAGYVQTAPMVRLRALRFAATFDQVLIWGQPLPPLAGCRCFEDGGIIVPCGFRWEPAIDAASVRGVLGLHEDDLAMFSEDGTGQRVQRSSFVHANRSAVRATVNLPAG